MCFVGSLHRSKVIPAVCWLCIDNTSHLCSSLWNWRTRLTCLCASFRCHNAGIQVLLDVVYNHTAELDDKHPYLLSFRGIDNQTYYMVDPSQYVQLINLSGCGNTVNANHPVVKQLIIDSLVHWVEEYHVDGFRFDLASCLCRGKSASCYRVHAIGSDKDMQPWYPSTYVGSYILQR